MAANPNFLQRLLQSIPGALQMGVDAAATPNRAFGGPADIFSGLSRASNLAVERAIKQAEQRRAEQDQELKRKQYDLGVLQYQRLLKQSEIDAADRRADNERADKNLERQNRSLELTTVPQWRNSGYREVTPGQQIDKSRVRTVGGIDFYLPTPEELAAEPLHGDALAKVRALPGARSRPVTSILSGQASVQMPAAFQGDGPPTPEAQAAAESQLPLISSLAPPVRIRKEFRTPTTPGYDRKLEQNGEFVEAPNPETLSAMQKPPTTFQAAAVRALLGQDADTADATINRLADANGQLNPTKTLEAMLVKAYSEGDDEGVQGLLELRERFKPGAAPKAALSDAALRMFGQFVIDSGGQMPALGQGSGEARIAVANAAAQMAGDGTNLAANRANNRSLSNSLSTVERQLNQTESFEKTARANLSRAMEATKGIQDTGSPLLNEVFRGADRKFFGSDQQAAFDAARVVAFTEISRVLNNPTGGAAISDSARKEAESVLNGNYTIGQLMSVANLLDQDMTTRVTSLREQVQQIRQQLNPGGGPSSAAPGGVPQVGGTFNGSKVLKVEKVTQ